MLITLAVVTLYGGAGLWQEDDQTVWSPYYRIDYHPNAGKDGYVVSVNNIGHQETKPIAGKEEFYFQLYKRLPSATYRRVLIIGAGTGSDVAIALANGAEYIDAVEIDPELQRLGALLNPAQPYQDKRVSVHINDGRAFLRHTDQKYDLIIYALTDSLTLTSSQANLRLESFLFTTESMADARAHLTEQGVVVLYNYYRQDWSIRKLAGMVEAAFKMPPYVVSYGAWGKAAVFIAGPGLARLPAEFNHPYRATAPEANPRFLPEIGSGRLSSDPALVLPTDDWPLFYLQEPGIPVLYLAGIAMVIVMALVFVFGLTPTGALRRFDWHFFFLGAAFMALETRCLVTFALLFGTTWLVNALVFFAILASVLLAILVNARWKFQHAGVLYVLLFALLAANYALPTGQLLEIGPSAARYVLASALAFAPVFLANIIFSRSFRDSTEADTAFASNLIGIMAGGLIEYGALMFGYQSLLIAVAACYAVAMLIQRRAALR